MNRSLEDQIRAVADRSVGEIPSPRERVERWELADLDAYAPVPPTSSHRGRALVAGAAILLLVAGVIAAIGVWHEPDERPVTTTPSDESAWASCPGSLPRRTVEGGSPPSGDGLPELSNAVTDRSFAEEVLARDSAALGQRYPSATDLRIGPGLGWAWTGVNGGEYSIVEVDSFGIDVRLPSLEDCPTGSDLYLYSGGPYPGSSGGRFPSAPLYFLVPADEAPETTVPVSMGTVPADWVTRSDVSGSSSSFTAIVTRRECSGGVTEPVSTPIVEFEPDRIVVTIDVVALPAGGGRCPSNPGVPVRVDLGQPLGDRVLIDGGCLEAGPLPSPGACERGRN